MDAVCYKACVFRGREFKPRQRIHGVTDQEMNDETFRGSFMILATASGKPVSKASTTDTEGE